MDAAFASVFDSATFSDSEDDDSDSCKGFSSGETKETPTAKPQEKVINKENHDSPSECNVGIDNGNTGIRLRKDDRPQDGKRLNGRGSVTERMRQFQNRFEVNASRGQVHMSFGKREDIEKQFVSKVMTTYQKNMVVLENAENPNRYETDCKKAISPLRHSKLDSVLTNKDLSQPMRQKQEGRYHENFLAKDRFRDEVPNLRKIEGKGDVSSIPLTTGSEKRTFSKPNEKANSTSSVVLNSKRIQGWREMNESKSKQGGGNSINALACGKLALDSTSRKDRALKQLAELSSTKDSIKVPRNIKMEYGISINNIDNGNDILETVHPENMEIRSVEKKFGVSLVGEGLNERITNEISNIKRENGNEKQSDDNLCSESFNEKSITENIGHSFVKDVVDVSRIDSSQINGNKNNISTKIDGSSDFTETLNKQSVENCAKEKIKETPISNDKLKTSQNVIEEKYISGNKFSPDKFNNSYDADQCFPRGKPQNGKKPTTGKLKDRMKLFENTSEQTTFQRKEIIPGNINNIRNKLGNGIKLRTNNGQGYQSGKNEYHKLKTSVMTGEANSTSKLLKSEGVENGSGLYDASLRHNQERIDDKPLFPAKLEDEKNHCEILNSSSDQRNVEMNDKLDKEVESNNGEAMNGNKTPFGCTEENSAQIDPTREGADFTARSITSPRKNLVGGKVGNVMTSETPDNKPPNGIEPNEGKEKKISDKLRLLHSRFETTSEKKADEMSGRRFNIQKGCFKGFKFSSSDYEDEEKYKRSMEVEDLPEEKDLRKSICKEKTSEEEKGDINGIAENSTDSTEEKREENLNTEHEPPEVLQFGEENVTCKDDIADNSVSVGTEIHNDRELDSEENCGVKITEALNEEGNEEEINYKVINENTELKQINESLFNKTRAGETINESNTTKFVNGNSAESSVHGKEADEKAGGDNAESKHETESDEKVAVKIVKEKKTGGIQRKLSEVKHRTMDPVFIEEKDEFYLQDFDVTHSREKLHFALKNFREETSQNVFNRFKERMAKLDDVINTLLASLEEENKLFSFVKHGSKSYFSFTRDPNEIDVLLIWNALSFDGFVTVSGDCPNGFTKVRIVSEETRTRVEKYCITEGDRVFLSPRMFCKDFNAVFTAMVSRGHIQIPGQKATRVFAQQKQKYTSCLKVRFGDDSFFLVRLLPAIRSTWPSCAHYWRTGTRKWPRAPVHADIIRKGVHLVAMPAESEDDQTWKVVFWRAQRRLTHIESAGCKDECMEIMKVLFDVNLTSKKGISFSDVENILMWLHKKYLKDSDWEESKLSWRFMELLCSLHKSLYKGYCHHYFMPTVNIFVEYDAAVLLDIASRVSHMIKDPYKYLESEKKKKSH